MTTVSLLSGPEDEAAYETFLERHPAATIYHSLAYRDLLRTILGARCAYAIARSEGTVTGVLPTMVLEGPYGQIMNSMPFFGSYGGVIALDATVAAALWSWFENERAQASMVAATAIENPFATPACGQLPIGALQDERTAQWTPLGQEPDFPGHLEGVIDSSARRNVRKARESGVRVRVDNGGLAFLSDCHRANMAEIGGLAKPPTFFDGVAQAMRPDRNYRIYFAEYRGQPIAALLLFLYKQFAEYIMPVTAPGYRDLQPTAAILFEALCDAQAEGRRIWNWGGTWLGQTGVYRFKRKWGALEKSYRYSVRINDDRLLDKTASELASAYPFFYAAPYKTLRSLSTL